MQLMHVRSEFAESMPAWLRTGFDADRLVAGVMLTFER